jgi:hypothetical protein
MVASVGWGRGIEVVRKDEDGDGFIWGMKRESETGHVDADADSGC